MAQLHVKSEPSAGATVMSVAIDGVSVPLAPEGESEGEAPVEGECGDGSKHVLTYLFTGEAGETLSVTVTCGGNQVCKLVKATVSAAGEPYCTGWKRFAL